MIMIKSIRSRPGAVNSNVANPPTSPDLGQRSLPTWQISRKSMRTFGELVQLACEHAPKRARMWQLAGGVFAICRCRFQMRLWLVV